MKPIDFQGIVSLERPLVDQLNRYLKEKEAQAAACILHAVPLLPEEPLLPLISPGAMNELTVTEAVEACRQHIQRITSSEKPLTASDDWMIAAKQINRALWEYVEILEGGVIELVQQLRQTGFERWRVDLGDVVSQLSVMLKESMNRLQQAIPPLESLLWEYRKALAPKRRLSFFTKVVSLWKPLIDRALLVSLRKSNRYLETRTTWFLKRYEQYVHLRETVACSLKKFSKYQILSFLEESKQAGFKKIYELLRLWELNLQATALPLREPVRVLRSAYNLEAAAGIFTAYYEKLKATLFKRSRRLKHDPNEIYEDPASCRLISEFIRSERVEVHTLGYTVGKFREFFLRTHPNPYIRSRWGFSEWMLGPEPAQTKELQKRVFEIEYLDKLYAKLQEALLKGPAFYKSEDLKKQHREIRQILHEMGQPLTSRGTMRTRAEKLLSHMEHVDELGSFNPYAVKVIDECLSKALRADWQYHVLFDFPLFHQLFEIHQGILGPLDDYRHLKRKRTFQGQMTQILLWVENREVHHHVREIETEMSDMKYCLQSFFAEVQRLKHTASYAYEWEEQAASYAKQLLEYRYQFGEFFHALHKRGLEGDQIRNQFLFVDQYVESIENFLHEIENN